MVITRLHFFSPQDHVFSEYASLPAPNLFLSELLPFFGVWGLKTGTQ